MWVRRGGFYEILFLKKRRGGRGRGGVFVFFRGWVRTHAAKKVFLEVKGDVRSSFGYGA